MLPRREFPGVAHKRRATARDAALNKACMAYVKQSITSKQDAQTTPFFFDGDGSNSLLGPDNALVSRTAVYLNDTGQIMHIEQALVLTYEFVPTASAAASQDQSPAQKVVSVSRKN